MGGIGSGVVGDCALGKYRRIAEDSIESPIACI